MIKYNRRQSKPLKRWAVRRYLNTPTAISINAWVLPITRSTDTSRYQPTRTVKNVLNNVFGTDIPRTSSSPAVLSTIHSAVHAMIGTRTKPMNLLEPLVLLRYWLFRFCLRSVDINFTRNTLHLLDEQVDHENKDDNRE
jgi:hypothetical protein